MKPERLREDCPNWLSCGQSNRVLGYCRYFPTVAHCRTCCSHEHTHESLEPARWRPWNRWKKEPGPYGIRYGGHL